MIIEVCVPVCVSVCFADLVNSQFHSPCSPRRRGGSGGSKIYTSTKSLLSIYPEVKLNSSGMSAFVEILIIRGEKRGFSLLLSPSLLFPLSHFFP